MHTLVLFLSIATAAWIWYRRAQMAARKNAGADPNSKGAIDRRGLPDHSAGSLLGAIDEPALAAIVFMVALGDCKPDYQDRVYEEIERQALYLFDTDDVEEVMSLAYEIGDKGPKLDDVIRTLAPIWNARLDPAQKTELLQMAHEIAAVGGTIEPRQKAGLRQLRQVLRIDQRA